MGAEQTAQSRSPSAAPASQHSTVSSGYRMLRLGRWVHVPYAVRTRGIVSSGVALIVGLSCLTLWWGPLGIGPADLRALSLGDADAGVTFVLERLRGPRVLVAIGVGIAFGLSGALFQTVTRNPLGSPDVIGLGAGAGAGVAVGTLFFPGLVPAPLGALAGAAVAIGLVWFSTGFGFASPGRIIITGIGVAAMSLALTQYVVAVALRDSASQLAAYLVGSLGTRNMGHVMVIVVALALLIPGVVALSHRLTPMDLGDDLATSLNGSATGARAKAIVLSVALAAAAVSVAGPIAFVALSAPHIARRLTRQPGPNLTASAVVGAIIMLSADFLVQHVPAFDGLPVGVITAGVGGVYLGYLLVSRWRRSSAGA